MTAEEAYKFPLRALYAFLCRALINIAYNKKLSE